MPDKWNDGLQALWHKLQIVDQNPTTDKNRATKIKVMRDILREGYVIGDRKIIKAARERIKRLQK